MYLFLLFVKKKQRYIYVNYWKSITLDSCIYLAIEVAVLLIDVLISSISSHTSKWHSYQFPQIFGDHLQLLSFEVSLGTNLKVP